MISKSFCLFVFWKFEASLWNILPARAGQSFEGDERSPARRAGGTIPVGQRSAVKECHCSRHHRPRALRAVCMYVCMVITYSKNMDQPGKVANPARGQSNWENKYSPVPVRCLIVWSRTTGSAVLSCSFSILRLNLGLTRGIPSDFRGGVHLFI